MSNDLPNYDKIIKELQIIKTIFHSQMNPDFHLGSGMGLPRYCNEIFIISDIEILKISDYKREYTSRIEQSNNISLAINELKTIYKKSIELYNYFTTNLYHHPDKKEFFVGEDAGQQIINSTGYYYFMNYKASFGFFEIEQDSEFMNSINSKFFKNGFRYHYKNENLVLFCVKLIEFINLSEVLIENKTTPTNPNENKKPETEKMYFKIGLLFAENKIYRILNNGTYEYYHLEKKFKSVNALHKHLGLTRKYIDDTFKELKTPHNIYKNLKYMRNIVDYCNKNEIQIHLEFSNKYTTLIQMQS